MLHRRLTLFTCSLFAQKLNSFTCPLFTQTLNSFTCSLFTQTLHSKYLEGNHVPHLINHVQFLFRILIQHSQFKIILRDTQLGKVHHSKDDDPYLSSVQPSANKTMAPTWKAQLVVINCYTGKLTTNKDIHNLYKLLLARS